MAHKTMSVMRNSNVASSFFVVAVTTPIFGLVLTRTYYKSYEALKPNSTLHTGRNTKTMTGVESDTENVK